MTSEARTTLAAFIAAENLSMQFQAVPENPHMTDPSPGMLHYFCTITKGAPPTTKTLRVYYSMGAGLAQRRTAQGWTNASLPYGARSVEEANRREHSFIARWRARPPELPDVLDCLAADAAGICNARSFDDWASEYGYDDDSRKAERIYRICLEEARKLEAFLGSAAYDTLLFKTERL